MSYEIKDFMADIDSVEKKMGKPVLRRCVVCGGKIHKMGAWGYNHMGAGVIIVPTCCDASPEECEARGPMRKGYTDGLDCFVFVSPEDPTYLAKKLHFHIIEGWRHTWGDGKGRELEKWAAENLKGWKYLPPPGETERLFMKMTSAPLKGKCEAAGAKPIP